MRETDIREARFEDADFQEAMKVDPLTGQDMIRKEMDEIENKRKLREEKARALKEESEQKQKREYEAYLKAKNAEDEPLESPEKPAL